MVNNGQKWLLMGDDCVWLIIAKRSIGGSLSRFMVNYQKLLVITTLNGLCLRVYSISL